MNTNYLLTVDDIAAKCRVSKQSVYKAIHQGQLPSQRFGRSVRVSQQDLDQYLTRERTKGGEIQ